MSREEKPALELVFAGSGPDACWQVPPGSRDLADRLGLCHDGMAWDGTVDGVHLPAVALKAVKAGHPVLLRPKAGDGAANL